VVFNRENQPQVAFEVDEGTHILMGPCQVCHAGQVFDVGPAYVCENMPKGSCTFQIGKRILQREIPPEQMQKLLKVGKSDLLRRFITRKGEPLDVVLTLTNGKIGWEFVNHEPRIRKK
jgi:DNA topoisomerase-3